MRSKGSPSELERRRVLAVARILDGYSAKEVAEFLGLHAGSVRRWCAAFQQRGVRGLTAKPVPGRPRKLTRTQEKIVLRWLIDSPVAHGFDTELWTAGRLAELIHDEWGIRLHPRYVADWLRSRGFSPQKPERVPRERNPEAIAAWVQSEWARLKKMRSGSVRTWFSSTKAAF